MVHQHNRAFPVDFRNRAKPPTTTRSTKVKPGVESVVVGSKTNRQHVAVGDVVVNDARIHATLQAVYENGDLQLKPVEKFHGKQPAFRSSPELVNVSSLN
ncbi:MAG: hypothetical protein NT019_02245 [Candidatus Adlerbacteria bacterium]|nr:hypothetical protein [Candidatus Adlerbacteria bacterium]